MEPAGRHFNGPAIRGHQEKLTSAVAQPVMRLLIWMQFCMAALIGLPLWVRFPRTVVGGRAG